VGEDKNRSQLAIVGTPDHDVGGLSSLRNEMGSSVEERRKVCISSVSSEGKLSQIGKESSVSLAFFVRVDEDDCSARTPWMATRIRLTWSAVSTGTAEIKMDPAPSKLWKRHST
jgi:hypothetical protein